MRSADQEVTKAFIEYDLPTAILSVHKLDNLIFLRNVLYMNFVLL